MKKRKSKLWDKMAKSYDSRFNKMYKDIFDIIPSAFDESDDVIEVGCGSGLVSYKIIPIVKRFVGVDFSQKMIDVANKKLEFLGSYNASFFVGNALELPEIGKYDKIALINILHIVDEPKKILKNLKSLMKPNGKIVIISYCHGESMNLKYKIGSHLMKLGSVLGLMGKLNRFKFDDLRAIVIENSLNIIEEKEINYGFPFLFLIVTKSNGKE